MIQLRLARCLLDYFKARIFIKAIGSFRRIGRVRSVATPFKNPRVSEVLDNRPLTADKGAEMVLATRAIWFEIAASHYMDRLSFILLRLLQAGVKTQELGMPNIE